MAGEIEYNSRHLRYFVTAAEYGSFRKAGIALGTQESVISRRIRDIEDQLGASLFQRHSSGVSLTLAGARFLERARVALRQLEQAGNDVAAIGRAEEGHVRVGIFASVATGFLFELLQTFSDRHPNVMLDLVSGDQGDHVAAVRKLEMDIAFVTGTAERRDCETDYLWSERVFVVLPVEHSLVRREEVAWRDLIGECFIVNDAPPGPDTHRFIIDRLNGTGHYPDIRAQLVGRDDLLAMVAVGRGITLTSEATVGVVLPGITYRPIANETLRFSAVWSARNDNPAARRMLSLGRLMARKDAQVSGTRDAG